MRFFSVSLFAALLASVPCLATVSDTSRCALESIGLAGHAGLQDAAELVEIECQPLTSSRTIKYDYDYCAAKDTFSEACKTAGGKVLLYNVDISCTQDDITIAIDAANVPECVGISCGEEGLSSKNDRVFSALERQLKGADFICSINGGKKKEPSPPLETMPTIGPLPSDSGGDTSSSESAGIPTDAPTPEVVDENSISLLGSNDTSGTGIASSSVFALAGLMSGFFVLALA